MQNSRFFWMLLVAFFSANINIQGACNLSINATITPSSCGLNNAAISVVPTGGTTPYSYTWTLNAAVGNVNAASNLASGNYTVTVNAGAGCVKDTTIFITPSYGPDIILLFVKDDTCAGNNGSVKVQGTASSFFTLYKSTQTAPLPLISNGTNSNFIGLAPNNYIFTITDAFGCKDTTWATIHPTPSCCNHKLTSKTVVNPTCSSINSGSITVGASLGTGPYTYTWSNGPVSASNTNLTAGPYTVTIKDVGTGCVFDTTFILSLPSAPVLNSIVKTDPSCAGLNDASLTVGNASGGTGTYSWGLANASNPNLFINFSFPKMNMSPGNYILRVKDSGGCTDTLAFTISVGPNCCTHTLSAVVTNPSCGTANGAINLSVTGGSGNFSYSWSNGSTNQNQSGLSAGPIQVTVKDITLNCTKDTTFTLSSPGAPVIAGSVSIQDETCLNKHDGKINSQPTASGGTGALTWEYAPIATPSATIAIASFPVSNLTPGTYILTVKDANNCKTSINFTIAVGPLCCNLKVNAVVTPTNCNQTTGAITVTPIGVGPYTHTWNNGGTASVSITNLQAGTYFLHLVDLGQSGCVLDSTFTVPNVGTNIKLDSVVSVADTCGGSHTGKATIYASLGTGVLSYAWSNSAVNTFSQTGLSAGTYSFTVQDATGCRISGSVVIAAGPSCCNIIASATPTNPDCAGTSGSIQTTIVSGGLAPFVYSLNGGSFVSSPLFSNLTAGAYSVVVKDASGCTANVSVTLTNSTGNMVITQTVVNAGCGGAQSGEIHLQVTNGAAPYTSTWSNSLPDTLDQMHLSAGTYSYTVSDANGCKKSGNAKIANLGNAVQVNLGNDSSFCVSGSLILNAGNSGKIYQWSTAETTQTIQAQTAGTYYVTVTDTISGCSTVDSIHILIFPNPVVQLPADTTILIHQTLTLTPTIVGGSGSGSYHWTASDYINCLTCPTVKVFPVDTTLFKVIFIDKLGCVDTAQIQVNVIDDYSLYVPNAFTPNGDNANDVLYTYARSVKEMNWQIFNRWGEKVFETADLNKGWDGTYKGIGMSPGVYVYHLNVTYLNDKTSFLKGSVTLIR